MPRFVRPLLVCVLAMLAWGAAADCVWPYWTISTRVAAEATSVTAADLNGDGRPEMIGSGAAAIVASMNVDGTIASTLRTVATGSFATPVIAGELTGGGGIDLAIVTTSPLALSVFPGNGDGTFQTPVATPLPTPMTDLVSGDFNRDGRADLALLASDAAQVHVMHAGSAGSFAAGAVLATRNKPTAIAAGDVDGDGFQDVVTASEGSSLTELFFGNGDGTFDPVVRQPSLPSVTAVIARDIEGDGQTDLAILSPSTNSVAVMRNLGGRTFGDPLSYAAVGGRALAVADLSGDSIADVALAAFDVLVYAGGPSGTLRHGRTWAEDDGPHRFSDVVAADFDGDGRTDIAMTSDPDPFRGIPRRLRVVRNLCGSSSSTSTHAQVVSAGDPVEVRVSVIPPAGQTTPPGITGTVSIRENDTTLGSATLSNGMARITLPPFPEPGTHAIVTIYGGDDQHEPSTNGPTTLTVVTERTDLTLEIAPTSVEYGMSPTITATATSSIAGPLTGSLIFEFSGQEIAASGNPATTHPVLYVGEHRAGVRYTGDATHPAAHAAPKTFTVRRGTPMIQLRPLSSRTDTPPSSVFIIGGQRPNTPGYPLTYRPTGTVSLYKNATFLGHGYLTGDGNHVTIPLTPGPGRHLYRVVYSGDGAYVPTDEYELHFSTPSTQPILEARGTEGRLRIFSSDHRSQYRKSPGGTWMGIGSGSIIDDTTALPATVYLYSSNASGAAPVDSGMRIGFSDDVLLAGGPIRAAHLNEIIVAANILRRAAGLEELAMSVQSGSAVDSADVQTLRDAINAARSALGAYAFPFTGTVSRGERIRATHIQELREAVR